jgi:hypothetical protein
MPARVGLPDNGSGLDQGDGEVLLPGARLVNPHPPACQQEKCLSALIQGNGFPAARRTEEESKATRSTSSGGSGSRMSTIARRRSSSFTGKSSITAGT